MSEDVNGILELYIDDIKLENVERYEREDVLEAINGYGGRSTNKTPGYRAVVDSMNMKDGYHTFKVKYISGDDSSVVITEKTTFIVKKYDGLLYIDSPTSSNFNSSLRNNEFNTKRISGNSLFFHERSLYQLI